MTIIPPFQTSLNSALVHTHSLVTQDHVFSIFEGPRLFKVLLTNVPRLAINVSSIQSTMTFTSQQSTRVITVMNTSCGASMTVTTWPGCLVGIVNTSNCSCNHFPHCCFSASTLSLKCSLTCDMNTASFCFIWIQLMIFCH